MSKNTTLFSPFLNNSLESYCGLKHKWQCWKVISSTYVQQESHCLSLSTQGSFMQGSARFGLSVDVDACLDQQPDNRQQEEGKEVGSVVRNDGQGRTWHSQWKQSEGLQRRENEEVRVMRRVHRDVDMKGCTKKNESNEVESSGRCSRQTGKERKWTNFMKQQCSILN